MDMKAYGIHNSLRTAIVASVIALGTGIGMVSCVDAKDPYSPNNGDQGRMGTVSVNSLGREGDFIVVEPAGSTKAGSAEVPDVETFRVAILDSKGQNVVRNNLTGEDYKWETFAEINGQMVTIPSGKYKLEAASLANEPLAGWEMPYYYGVQDFTVRIAELARVDLVCKLANVKVTVEYDQEFLDKVDNPQVQVYFDYTDPATAKKVSADLLYAVGETRAGYFKVPADGKLYVKVTGTRKEDGKPIGNDDNSGQTKIISGVEAMQWHKVKVGYQQTGQISASVTVDYSTIDSEHTVEIPDGDGVIDGGSNNDNWDNEGGGETGGDEPSIAGANFNGSTFDITQQLTVSVADDNVIDVRFDAPEGIDQLFVTIESDALASLLPGLGLANGVPFDIANPPALSQKPEDVGEEMWWVNMFAMDDIGILDPNVPIKGKKSHTFKVGGLMSLLGSVADPANNGPAVHKFGLKMVDASGAVKEATLAVYLTE